MAKNLTYTEFAQAQNATARIALLKRASDVLLKQIIAKNGFFEDSVIAEARQEEEKRSKNFLIKTTFLTALAAAVITEVIKNYFE